MSTSTFSPNGKSFTVGFAVDRVEMYEKPISELLVTLMWKGGEDKNWCCWSAHTENDVLIVPILWFAEQQEKHPDKKLSDIIYPPKP